MALSTIPFSGLGADASNQGVNFRNLIINGDMSIAQRGTSSSGQTTAGYKSLDRYRFNIDGLGTWTISQDSDVPTGQGFGYSQKIACTTANASPSAGNVMQMQYKIEGQMLQHLKKGTSSAESLTLSFWVRSNKTGTYVAELYDMDNTRSISKSYTINSADTWEKKTLTYAGDTTGSFTNDNNLSLQLYIWLASGTRYTSGTLNTSWGSITDANRASGQVNLGDSSSNTFYITGVQLEVGTSASDFEFLPRDVNLFRCRRYYYDSNADTNQNLIFGVKSVVSQAVTNIYLPVEMRANPSFTAYGDSARAEANKYQVSGSGGYASAQEVYVSSRMGYFLLYSPNNSYNHLLLGGFVADAEL